MEGKNQEEADEQDAPPPEEPPPEEPPPEEPPPEEPEELNESPAEETPVNTSKAGSLQPAAEEASVGNSAKESTSVKDVDKLKMKTQSAVDTVEKQVKKLILKRKVDSTGSTAPVVVNTPCSEFLNKRSPFIHDPPQPEERRARIANPRTPKDYIINLREDLADFQETHGLPRTRDYTFVSLGLALAQETARAVYSLVLMFTELFPIVAIISLIVRFALDKLIEILETTEPVPKLKKSVVFALEMLVIIIPLWILVGTIILPLISLVFSIFKRMFRLSGGRKRCSRAKTSRQCGVIGFFF